jgi:hypothetical protein
MNVDSVRTIAQKRRVGPMNVDSMRTEQCNVEFFSRVESIHNQFFVMVK